MILFRLARSTTRRFGAAFWIAAAGVAWAAFAWLSGGAWAIPGLALLHAATAWYRERGGASRLPWRRLHGGHLAAWILGGVSLSIAAGYRPDWLIQAGLVLATLARVARR